MSNYVFNIYTDGSFSSNESDRTYGGFYMDGLGVEMLAYTTRPNWISSRNVGGELLAVVLALKVVESFREQNPDANITCNFFYDYEGVGKWVKGMWKCNKDLTRGYKNFVNNVIRKNNINDTWTSVHGHAGVYGNERADRLVTRSDRRESAVNMDDIVKEIA